MSFLDTKAGGIVISIVIAVGLVLGAYYLSTFQDTIANAASNQDLLKAYATKDSDGDGVPDWEESLYGLNPNNPDTLGKGIGDAEAIKEGLVKLRYQTASTVSASSTLSADDIPGPDVGQNTLTSAFAHTFFDNYISTRGTTPPSADQAVSFVQGAVANLEQTRSRPDAYTAANLHIQGSGSGALRAYAANVDSVFAAHQATTTQGEMAYFESALEKNDPVAAGNIATIANQYLTVAQGLASLPVPSDIASQHLALINAMARLGSTIKDLSTVNSDPVRAMLGLQAYPADAQELAKALENMATVFNTENATVQPYSAGSMFYHLITTASSTAAS